MSDEFLRATTRDERHSEIVKELEFTSYMCVPIASAGPRARRAHARVVGIGPAIRQRRPRARRGVRAVAPGLATRQRAPLLRARPRRAGAAVEPVATVAARRSPAPRDRARTRPRARATRSAATSTTCSRSTSDAWWFVIGDVSGKGPEAAAIAGPRPAHVARARAAGTLAPAGCSRALHETLLVGEGHGEFCTVCCALLQPTEHRARRSRSRAAVIRRRSSAAPTARVEVATCTGPLLGMPVELAFVEQSVDLEPGDIVVLYTDGVTEAHHRNQPLFGEERLIEVIARAATTSTPSRTTSSPQSATTVRPSPVTTSRWWSFVSTRAPTLPLTGDRACATGMRRPGRLGATESKRPRGIRRRSHRARPPR